MQGGQGKSVAKSGLQLGNVFTGQLAYFGKRSKLSEASVEASIIGLLRAALSNQEIYEFQMAFQILLPDRAD
jgi:hypothetical protein